MRNSTRGVVIEVEGRGTDVDEFCGRLRTDAPPRSAIHGIEVQHLEPSGARHFEIRESEAGGEPRALMLPDIATCAECLREIFDPANRRYRYPFTNCTHCGPRFSIIEALPYDRANTTMRVFTMCEACRREYENPVDRRFHAQPNACPKCGPQVALWDSAGVVIEERDGALIEAARAIREGAVVAVKGLGGFHLIVDARNGDAVKRLRERKHREEKPLAVMFPSLSAVRENCEVAPIEERLLCSPEAPIVLLGQRARAGIAADVAPGNPNLGALLPYTPVHHLLLAELGVAVVATSGNLSDEPICTDETDAPKRLAGIADVFLVHNRPIIRHVDDSVVRVIAGREIMLRRARGFAPLPIQLSDVVLPTLALGAHLKNTIALATGADVFLSQHIGDLDSAAAVETLRRIADDFQRIYRVRPRQVVTDEHPDYASSQLAHGFDAPVATLQHHCAHILSCMAEHDLVAPVLGVAWDGTGYGSDGTIWGGEFLKITADGFARVAHLRTFRLPGGDVAAREPWRCALGMLHEIIGESLFRRRSFVRAFTKAEITPLQQMLSRGVNCPITSSAGRLFDAVASLLGLRRRASFEGQAAMELEFAIGDCTTDETYAMPLKADGVIDWAPAVLEILADRKRRRSAAEISAKFHNALVEAIVAVAHRVDENRIVLSGGCFQNKYLTERVIRRLREEGFRPAWHQRVPPNDGGIALGQIAGAARAYLEANPQ